MVEISFVAGEPPAGGTLVVLVGPDGAMSEAAAKIDAASQGLLGRMLAAEPGGARHGRALYLPYPPGTGLDAVWPWWRASPAASPRSIWKSWAARLFERLRGFRVREAVGAPHRPASIWDTRRPRSAALLGHGARLRGYSFDKYTSPPSADEAPVRLDRLVVRARRAERRR